MTAVGGAHTARWHHDGVDAVPTHHPFDPAANAAAVRQQDSMDAGAAVASTAVLMDLSDRSQQHGIGFDPLTGRFRQA
jgi:hypothetical protein